MTSMVQPRLDLAFMLALLAFNLAAHAAPQTSRPFSLSTPLPRALHDRLSPLSRQQGLYYGKLIKRGGLQAMSESVLYEFCTTARLLCSASLQRSKWGHAGGAKTALLSFDTSILFNQWAKRAEEPSASASKTEVDGRDQTEADNSFFTQWRGNSREGEKAAKSEGTKQYFREKDLMIGAQLVLPSFLYQSASDDESNAELKPSFLPASIALNLPPFDMQHLTDLLQLLHIPFDTDMVKKMEETLKSCSEALMGSGKGKEKDDDDDDDDDDHDDDDNDDDDSTQVGLGKKKKKKDDDDDNSTVSSCVTSLEAMLKFVCSMLSAPAKEVQALTNSEVVGSEGGVVTILQVTELAPGHDTVDCHELVFPFKVMGCHRIKESKAMVVRVAEERGKNMDLLVACHKNTTLFNPHHEAFSQLQSSPGHTEICHFLPNTDIMWISL